jgi:hypothetical protein
MANDHSYLRGLQPRLIEIIEGISQILGDRTTVKIDRANITVAANDTWSYVVPFRLIGEDSGLVLPYTGTIGASISQTTGSGQTPTVSSATPAITMGSGEVTVAWGAATGWGAGEVATLVLTYTNLRGGTDTANFTVTMS